MPYKKYHAVFLDLEGRKCVVAGGGAIALEKVASLMEAGASVRVVSPQLSRGLQEKADRGELEWTPREFRDEDAKDAFLAIGATDNESVNRRVFSAAERLGRLGNSVDDPDNCNFIFAAVAKSGPMQVAVSSAGCSPAMAQLVRDRIGAEILSEAMGDLAEFLGEWRPSVKDRIGGYENRKKFWQDILESEIPLLVAGGATAAADSAMRRRLDASHEARIQEVTA